MPDRLRFIDPLPRGELRRALRAGDAFEPPLRVFAEDLLGADATIDLVGVDPAGRVIVVLTFEQGEDREAIARALAQRAWVRPRLADWLQLAPSLPFAADAPVVVRLLCPEFSSDTLAAARELGPEIVELATVRCVQNGAEATVLVSRVGEPPEAPRTAPAAPSASPSPSPEADTRFRSGLSEADLGLTPEEVRDFE